MPTNDPLTAAGRTYLSNAEHFSTLMEMIGRGVADRLDSIQPAKASRATSHGPAVISKATETAPAFLHLWYVVMLVTFVEAFLHDALTECAAAAPLIMGNTEQRASYSEVVALGTFEAVEHELRSRWARNFVDDGGPTRWISRLGRMFGGQYSDHLLSPMEEAWGVRHMVVHHAGVTSAEFARRHPALASGAGQRLSLPLNVVFNYASAIGQFVRITDDAIGRRIAASSDF